VCFGESQLFWEKTGCPTVHGEPGLWGGMPQKSSRKGVGKANINKKISIHGLRHDLMERGTDTRYIQEFWVAELQNNNNIYNLSNTDSSRIRSLRDCLE